MSVYFAIENGVLVRKLFVGPIQVIDSDNNIKESRHSIAKQLEQYENVSENVLNIQNIKEQQAIIAATADNNTTSNNASSNDSKAKRVIRRRRKFVYSAADEIIEKGYWHREKRSLTKFHSNSLMFEYTQIRGRFSV